MKIAQENNHLSLNARPELLEVVANISDIKDIKEEFIFNILEEVLTKVAVGKYGSRYNIRVRIHRGNGAIIVEKVTTVVDDNIPTEADESILDEGENIFNPDIHIKLSEAQNQEPSYKVEDLIIEELPTISFGRSVVQRSLGFINANIREFEKKREYNLYKEREGDLISGTVRRNEFGNIIVDLGSGAEGFLRRDQLIPHENLNVGERIRALIVEVKEDSKGPQIILSRKHPNFIVKLFTQEIPEIFDKVVEIKAIAREAGVRSKVVVASNDTSVDPVGVCVGFKGSKINNILQELKGERIDLIKYYDDFSALVMECFKPNEILKIIMDEESEKLEVVLPESQLSIAIGRGGQNIKLISKLLQWNIDVLSEEAEKEKRQLLTQERIKFLKERLDIDEVISHLLVLEGYNKIEDVANTEDASLLKIEGFEQDLIDVIKSRAKLYIAESDKKINEELDQINPSKDLRDFEGIDLELKLFLAKKGIITLENLADLASFELEELLEDSEIKLSHKKVEDIIMLARKVLNY